MVGSFVPRQLCDSPGGPAKTSSSSVRGDSLLAALLTDRLGRADEDIFALRCCDWMRVAVGEAL